MELSFAATQKTPSGFILDNSRFHQCALCSSGNIYCYLSALESTEMVFLCEGGGIIQ